MGNNCQVRVIIASKDLTKKGLPPLSGEFIVNLDKWFSPTEHKEKLQQLFNDIFDAFDSTGNFPDITQSNEEEEKD